MNIGIIDADLLDGGTRHPNLALMKISGYHKSQGNEVELLTRYTQIEDYDKVFVSKVFSFTHVPNEVTQKANVRVGGTGFFPDGGACLSDGIEHHKPDYDLYTDYVMAQISAGKKRNIFSDYLDYSIGFTTRGCFRKCSFCVNKKYSSAFKHSPVSEFLDIDRRAIYLWDDNFLAYSGWAPILDELEATSKSFQFRQGLDIRLMTAEKAIRLSRVKYHGDFIFAFDHIKDKDLIEQKLQVWRRFCDRSTKLYILCAYESQDEHDIENVFRRIAILMRYECLPYIMRYDGYKNSQFKDIYTQLARWCNQPSFFKKMSFRQFCTLNQAYHKNPETKCSAYKSMLDFAAKFPAISKKYFDMSYDSSPNPIKHYSALHMEQMLFNF